MGTLNRNVMGKVNLAAILLSSFMPKVSLPKNIDPAQFEGRHKYKRRARRNPLSGYYKRHSHVLTEYCASQNLSALQNGKSKFKGFRKVRKTLPNGFSKWVPV